MSFDGEGFGAADGPNRGKDFVNSTRDMATLRVATAVTSLSIWTLITPLFFEELLDPVRLSAF